MSASHRHMRVELNALASVKLCRLMGCRKALGGKSRRGIPPVRIHNSQPAKTPGHTEIIVHIRDQIGLSRWQIVTSDVAAAMIICKRYSE